MNKKITMILSLCIALTMLLCGCITKGEHTPSENETTLPEGTAEATTAATEESVPGVVENPFDDEPPVNNNTESSENVNNGENSNTENAGNSGNDEPNKPEETQPSTGGNGQPENGGETPTPDEVTYEEYNAMSGEEQMAFYNSFESMEDFVAWYNAAKAKYEKENPDIEIGDGNIDIGDIVGGGN